MEKEMEKEKNMQITKFYSMENIYIIINIKVKNILMEIQNLKENIYLIKNGMGMDMMKMEI